MAASMPPNASPVRPAPDTVVSHQLALPNFLTAKIALDRIVDPSIQPAEVEVQVGKLIAAARTFTGPHPSVGAQFDAVRKVLYEPGPWNDNRPFTYDHADPFGENVQHKLLSGYLRTRLGNCVTMPILFMIVGRGVGLHLTLTDAPLHLLVRYTHPGIPTLNVEATSGGGFARDVWYQQQLSISDRAMQSGLYLRTHTDRETIALMATTVLDYLLTVGRNEEAIKVADVILAADPKEGYAMVKKGSARIRPRHSVACPFPQEEVMVRPKMTIFMPIPATANRTATEKIGSETLRQGKKGRRGHERAAPAHSRSTKC